MFAWEKWEKFPLTSNLWSTKMHQKKTYTNRFNFHICFQYRKWKCFCKMNPTQMAYKTKIFKIDPYVNDSQNTNRKVYHSKLIIYVYTVISNKIILLKTGKYKTNWYTTERIKSLQLMFDLLINIIWVSADIKSLGCSYRP
jgi:hypothetical protein